MIANHLCNYFSDLQDKVIFASVLGTDDTQAVEQEKPIEIKDSINKNKKLPLFLPNVIGQSGRMILSILF